MTPQKVLDILNDNPEVTDFCRAMSDACNAESVDETNGWVKAKAEYLFEFTYFSQWVNKASSWFKPYKNECFCLDKNGNYCHIGEDFQIADDNDLFPIKAYRRIRTKEANPPQQ